jgi:hypothetical protein
MLTPGMQKAQASNCKECLFEREKRLVKQRAFEKAMQISMMLMEEIEKLSLNPSSDDHQNTSNITR